MGVNSYPVVVDEINRLYDEGHYIILMTARGRGSGKDWTGLTEEFLERWGVKYHELEPMFHKPTADLFIDDKGIDVEVWKKQINGKRGIVSKYLTLIHPGYVRLFKEAKQHCWPRELQQCPFKMTPVQTIEETKQTLLSMRDVDDVDVIRKKILSSIILMIMISGSLVVLFG